MVNSLPSLPNFTHAITPLPSPFPLFLISPLPRLSLLLQIMLHPALLRLARVVPVLVLGLLDPVPSQARDSTAHRTRHAVADSRAEILQLAASLLLLACAVLFAALLFECLLANQSASS